LFVGRWALAQLWLFWIVPLAGGALGGIAYTFAFGSGRLAREKPAIGAAGEHPA
jgi:aquaporin Z